MTLGLFEGFGVEIEYMIVTEAGLDTAPVCDRLLAAAAGSITNEVTRGPLAWSNELALHVVELKTNGPAPGLAGLAEAFAHDVHEIETLLAADGARLMPGAMHPWMDPFRELVLWPHDDSPIYAAFDRIFDCRGHGWANLQSVHLNLPFRGDRELHLLHGAIRNLLPLLPALAASSPIADARDTGFADYRMEVYRHNSARIPEIAGQIVPEVITSRSDYQTRILEPAYRAIAALDPGGILQEEWLNARGAIARFDRNAVEIRVLDTQEHPGADLAILALVTAVLRATIEGRWCRTDDLDTLQTERLAAILRLCVADGDDARIDDGAWLATFGLGGRRIWARDLWAHLLTATDDLLGEIGVEIAAVEHILDRGTLARRLRHALGIPMGRAVSRGSLAELWLRLADCLRQGTSFDDR